MHEKRPPFVLGNKMMRIFLFAGMLVCAATAQPPVIRVVRNGRIGPYVTFKPAVNVIGMFSLAGPSEGWLVELHDSFGSLEDLDKALIPAGSITPDASALIGTLRPDLSYRGPEITQNLPKMRYFDVATYHVDPATYVDFEKFLKARRTAMSSVNLDRPNAVYQIVAGEPVGTFVVITPLASLRVFDDAHPQTPVYAEGAQAAVTKAAAVAEFVSEHTWFRVDPGFSYVSDDFSSADTDFWRPGPR
jgi:hypothetical protein